MLTDLSKVRVSGRDKVQLQQPGSRIPALHDMHRLSTFSGNTVTEVTMQASFEKKKIFNITSFPIHLILKRNAKGLIKELQKDERWLLSVSFFV